MTKVLFSWIGNRDLDAFAEGVEPENAPLIRAVQHRDFDEIYIARDNPDQQTGDYIEWIRSETRANVHFDRAKLSSAVSYGDIYNYVAPKLKKLFQEIPDIELTVHLSPGTPQMASVSLLICKTLYPAKFLQSSPAGLVDVEIPFDISAEYLPVITRKSGQSLLEQLYSQAPTNPEFEKIIGESPQLADAISDAKRFSIFDIPVLILGESGTGKELFANAIRQNCESRDPKIHKSVNCGALAGELVNSELFGHTKGAFTGATADKKGVFEAANGGTVFLDEFGELPLDSQVRLLRVLQEGTVTPIGSTEEKRVDVRVIAATNRNLTLDIAENRFREDLFHRVAVGVVNLPPLRERQGDIKLLTAHFMESIAMQLGFEHKSLSASALNVIMEHNWPGNVRELENALKRACVLSPKDKIDESNMRRALILMPRRSTDFLPSTIGSNFSLEKLVETVEKKYITMAMTQTKHKKTKASALLGIKNHQNLTRKLIKYGLDD